jgi:hypothetical protein
MSKKVMMIVLSGALAGGILATDAQARGGGAGGFGGVISAAGVASQEATLAG